MASVMPDVFICHASEDKLRFVEPLASALIQRGLTVWYDRLGIGLSDDVVGRIDEGLRESRFAVVLISQRIFRDGKLLKPWASLELSALVNQEFVTGQQRIFAVRCDLSHEELTARSPILATRRSVGWEL